MNRPKMFFINEKIYFYNNIAKIEYTTLKQILNEYSKSSKSFIFNVNQEKLFKKFNHKNKVIIKNLIYVTDLFKLKLKIINKEIEKLESKNNQKIIRESKPKN